MEKPDTGPSPDDTPGGKHGHVDGGDGEDDGGEDGGGDDDDGQRKGLGGRLSRYGGPTRESCCRFSRTSSRPCSSLDGA